MSSSRQQLPPWDFECAYQRRCPHLHGSSTQLIWEEHKRSYKEHCEHWRVRDILREELEKALAYIGALEEQNEQLKAKLKALHQRQFKSNKNRDQQSSNNSADNCSEQANKKTRCAQRPSGLV